VLAAEAVYGLQEAAVEVGAPPHPGLLGPDVPPHYSAIPAAAAAAAAHVLDRQQRRRVLTSLDDMELAPGPSKETPHAGGRGKNQTSPFVPSSRLLVLSSLPRSLTSPYMCKPAQSCCTGKQAVAGRARALSLSLTHTHTHTS